MQVHFRVTQSGPVHPHGVVSGKWLAQRCEIVRPYSVQNVLRWRGVRFRQKVDAGRWRCPPSAFWSARLLDEISLYSTQERALLGTDFVSEGPAGLPVKGSGVLSKKRAWGVQALAACLCLRSATFRRWRHHFRLSKGGNT